MRRNNKKGFTIVELVIVIAVIAILAGVLIPTFAGIVAKANKSAAEQEAANAYKEDLAMLNAQVDKDYEENYEVDGYALKGTFAYDEEAKTYTYTYETEKYTCEYSSATNKWTVEEIPAETSAEASDENASEDTGENGQES